MTSNSRLALRVVGVAMLMFCLANWTMAAVGWSYGPLPLGVGKARVSAATGMLIIPDNFGQPVPQGASSVTAQNYADLTSAFWSGEWLTEGKEKHLPYEPPYYFDHSPRSIAESIFQLYPTEIKKDGYRSPDDLVKIFQTDPKKSAEICTKYKQGIYITENNLKIVGFRPASDFWDPRLYARPSIWEGGLGQEGWTLDQAIALMERSGYSKQFIADALREMFYGEWPVGSSIESRGISGSGWIEQLFKYTTPSKDPYLVTAKYKHAEPVLRGLRFPGYILAADGHIISITVDPLTGGFRPSEDFFRRNKLPIDELKGEGGSWIVLHGEYADQLTPQRKQAVGNVHDLLYYLGVSSENKPRGMVMPKLGETYDPVWKGGPWIGTGPSDSKSAELWKYNYDQAKKNNPSLTDAQHMWLADQTTSIDLSRFIFQGYEKWCKDKGLPYVAISSMPPSQKLADYGVDPKTARPGPVKVAFQFLMEGDPLAYEWFITGIKDEKRAAEWKDKVRNRYADWILQEGNAAIDKGAGYRLDQDRIDWLAGLAQKKPSYQQKLDAYLEKLNRYLKDTYTDVIREITGNFKIAPSNLGVEVWSKAEACGWKWDSNRKEWVWVGIKADPTSRPNLVDTPIGEPFKASNEKEERLVDGSKVPPDQTQTSIGALDEVIRKTTTDIVTFSQKYNEYVQSLQSGESAEFDAFMNKIGTQTGVGVWGPVVQQLVRLSFLSAAQKSIYALVSRVQSPLDQLGQRGRQLWPKLRDPELVLLLSGFRYGASTSGLPSHSIIGSFTIPVVKLTVDNLWFLWLIGACSVLAVSFVGKKRKR